MFGALVCTRSCSVCWALLNLLCLRCEICKKSCVCVLDVVGIQWSADYNEKNARTMNKKNNVHIYIIVTTFKVPVVLIYCELWMKRTTNNKNNTFMFFHDLIILCLGQATFVLRDTRHWSFRLAWYRIVNLIRLLCFSYFMMLPLISYSAGKVDYRRNR